MAIFFFFFFISCCFLFIPGGQSFAMIVELSPKCKFQLAVTKDAPMPMFNIGKTDVLAVSLMHWH